jgi:DNA-binding GntR family transcriptional regulator
MRRNTLAPVVHSTAAEAATSALFAAIVDGTIAPGSHLRLNDLADQFQLSMMPVREAIRRLAALGLVEMEPHKGAFVRPMTMDDVTTTYETRFLIEGAAARKAAASFTPAAEQTAREALRDRARYLERGDAEHARDAHERFHFTIYDAAANPWLNHSIMPLWRNSERYRIESMRHRELNEQRAREHEEILAAVVAGDGDAAEAAMVAHLRASMQLIIDTFSEREPQVGGDPADDAPEGTAPALPA